MASTLLCVPIMVQDEPTAIADMAAARDAGADIVELRIDEFFSGVMDASGTLEQREVSAILRLVAQAPLPCIVTCRSQAEGGHYDGDEMARVSLYERLGTAGRSPRLGVGKAAGAENEVPPKYLDIEYAAYTSSHNLKQKVNLAVDHARQGKDLRTGLIVSFHDFAGRPSDLLRRVAAMGDEPAARIVKVAYTARSIRDNLELLDLLAENAAGKPTIALGMGRFGLLSRVLAPKFGGFLTFAALRKQSATAPGQPTVREMVDLYRFRAISKRTRVFGVIGDPVEHSLSPAVHNAGFESLAADTWDESERAAAVDGVYLPMPVPGEYEHFKATMSALIDHTRLDFAGCSVTLPHKQHLVRLALERIASGEDDFPWEIDEVSRLCGAANTLLVDRDAHSMPTRVRVRNTDAPAAVACLSEGMGGGLSGKRIALIGAGGVARAIAAGLVRAGSTVVVYNRTLETAQRLCDELAPERIGAAGVGAKLVAAALDALPRTCCDAIVNCTPVGMRHGPSPGKSPVDFSELRQCPERMVVMDTVYTPLTTPMLEQAALAGHVTIDGLGMFVRQAAMQFEMFFGHARGSGGGGGPVRLFDRVAREALGQGG